MRHEPKKTDFIEVRLPSETKTAFMRACQQGGTTASAVLRGFIERYVRSASRAPVHWKQELQMLLKTTSGRVRTAAATLAAVGLATLVASSIATPARAATDPRVAAVFEWFDANHNGKVSQAEFNRSVAAPEPMGAMGLVIDTKTRPANETREGLFKRLDSDRDGTLSLSELAAEAVVRTIVTPAIAAADSNGDGRFSEAELAAYIAAQRAAERLPNPTAGAALMAHGIVAEHDRSGHGFLTLADLER